MPDISTFDLDGALAALAAPFDLWQHEYRKQGRGDDIMLYLTYVGIEHVIARFNAVLGGRWSWTVLDIKTSGPDDKPRIIVHGRISFEDNLGKTWHRDGLGAAQWQSQADDLDKIVKSAQAEAFKKASHQFGMAGYLWDKGLADQIALELLRQEGRPWAAKSRPKLPAKGNTAAAAILSHVQQQGPAPEPKATSKSRSAPAKGPELSPEALAAFEAIKGAVKAIYHDKPPAAQGKLVKSLIFKQLGTQSLVDTPVASLQQLAKQLQDKPARVTEILARPDPMPANA